MGFSTEFSATKQQLIESSTDGSGAVLESRPLRGESCQLRYPRRLPNRVRSGRLPFVSFKQSMRFTLLTRSAVQSNSIYLPQLAQAVARRQQSRSNAASRNGVPAYFVIFWWSANF